MSEIAAVLHCDTSNVTGIVDGLEEKGLAPRQPSESDRRVKLIALTAEGRRLRARLTRAIEKPPAWIEGLSAPTSGARDLLRAAADLGRRRCQTVELTVRCASEPAPTASRWPSAGRSPLWGRLRVEGLEAVPPRAGRC